MKLEGSLRTDGPLPHAETPGVHAPVGELAAQRILIGILLFATIFRVFAALLHGNTVVALPGIYDQISYDGLARRVIGGYGFSFGQTWWPITPAGEPTAHWSFLYTLYLAAVYALFGPQPLVARLIQAVLTGFLHSWLAWRVGRRIFGPTVGLVAAGVSAVYLYFVYYAGALLTEPFYLTGILWTVDVALRLAGVGQTRPRDNRQAAPRLRCWVEFGLAIGVTVLLRQLFLLFVPFLFGWLWWNRTTPQPAGGAKQRLTAHPPWRVVMGLVLTTVMVVLLVLPW
ncbi:MAG: glycosyltransferase family 39 protein, partial [Caldilineaceae bacterium]|nr:glycosyltransferase family 39 protein [Caldilineaceae bacterium]